MFVSQVTNQDIVNEFEVSIIDSIYAEDSKGRRHFLTDLRTKFVKKANTKASNIKSREKNKGKMQENIEDFFVELDRAFPEFNVLIRETQPGIDLSDLGFNVYCIISPFGKHQVSMYSKLFNREELIKEFGYYKHRKNEDNKTGGLCITGVTFDEIVEIINQAIEIHKS